jgi:hypothetical protein
MPATVIAERIGWPFSIRTSSDRVAELRPAYLPADPASRTPMRYDRTRRPRQDSASDRAGRMHHLGVGGANAHRRVLASADQTSVTVIDLATCQILSTHTIDSNRSYWRNQQKTPRPMARA